MTTLLNAAYHALSSQLPTAMIGIVLTALATYHVNRLAALSPRKREILKYRLENVLLPLHAHSAREAIKSGDRLTHAHRANFVYESHMPYVSSDMQLIIAKLNETVSAQDGADGKTAQKLLNALRAQTEYEYELVRRKLRLPSKKFRVCGFMRSVVQRNAYSLDALLNWSVSPMFVLLLSFAALTVLHHHLFYRFAAADVITLILMVATGISAVPFFLVFGIGAALKLFKWLLEKFFRERPLPKEN